MCYKESNNICVLSKSKTYKGFYKDRESFKVLKKQLNLYLTKKRRSLNRVKKLG
jgi:hypothetical protein